MVRTLCQQSEAKRILLIEMLARTVKNILRARLREAFKQGGLSKYKHPKVVVCEVLNLVFGTTDEASRFWKEELLPKMQLSFPAEKPKEMRSTDTPEPPFSPSTLIRVKEADVLAKKKDPLYYNLFGLKKKPSSSEQVQNGKGKEKLKEKLEVEYVVGIEKVVGRKERSNSMSKRKVKKSIDLDDEVERKKDSDAMEEKERDPEQTESNDAEVVLASEWHSCAEKSVDPEIARGRYLLQTADVLPLLNRVQHLAGIKIADPLIAKIHSILQPFLPSSPVGGKQPIGGSSGTPTSFDSLSTNTKSTRKSSYRQRGFPIGGLSSNFGVIPLLSPPSSPANFSTERRDLNLAIFTKKDIHKIVARVKEMPIVDELEGRAALLNARYPFLGNV